MVRLKLIYCFFPSINTPLKSVHKNMWQCLHSSLYIKIRGFNTWIWDPPIVHISLNYSFLWDTQQTQIRSFSGESPPTYVHGRDISASIIFTPFHLHNSRRIAPISRPFSPNIAFRLYFGANTMWYLQFHFECAKLCMSFILECPPFGFYFWVCRPHFYYTKRSFLFQELYV